MRALGLTLTILGSVGVVITLFRPNTTLWATSLVVSLLGWALLVAFMRVNRR